MFLDITQVFPILLNITNITKYYIILLILHNIIHQRFTNITQFYISNITQYSIGDIQYQFYSILPILLTQYYSIFLNLKTVLFQFNMCQYSSILQAISNIHQYPTLNPQYHLSNLEMLYLKLIPGGRSLGPAARAGAAPWPSG